MLGGAAFSASLISSVSSLDQCKTILAIKKVKLWFVFANFSSNIADMSKMEPYCDFKASIGYRLKTSINFYRPKLLQTLNGSQKPDTSLDWVNGKLGCHLALAMSAPEFKYQMAQRSAIASVTFLDITNSQRSPL